MKTLSDIDWDTWTPTDTATLCFIVKEGKILLIHKKRGLGKGKINGPGGRIEEGETLLECAIRETQEELLITPLGLRERGTLAFQFADGYSLHCTVFSATDFEGEPTETEEARPEWFPTDAIPYENMWEDDRYWLPEMLAGKQFDGRFLFDEDRMLGKTLVFSDSP